MLAALVIIGAGCVVFVTDAAATPSRRGAAVDAFIEDAYKRVRLREKLSKPGSSGSSSSVGTPSADSAATTSDKKDSPIRRVKDFDCPKVGECETVWDS